MLMIQSSVFSQETLAGMSTSELGLITLRDRRLNYWSELPVSGIPEAITTTERLLNEMLREKAEIFLMLIR